MTLVRPTILASMEAPSDEPGRPRLAPLDGLRAVAVLFVFFAHSIGDRVPGGFVGVDIFFVLSGYLITGLLVREWQTQQSIDVAAFYIRRALRLYPALSLALVGVAVITPLIGYGWPHFLLDSIFALTYTYDFWAVHQPASLVGHFWSLSVEEQYYVLWPPLLIVFLRRGTRTVVRATALAVGVSFAVQVVSALTLGGGRVYFLPLGHANELLIGSLFAIVLAGTRATTVRRLTANSTFAWAAWVPIAVVALTARHVQAEWLYLGGLAGLAACSCVIIGHLVGRPVSLMGRLLGSAPAAWFGKRSYAFYLFHQPVIILLRHYNIHYRWLLPAALLITTVLVWVSFALVERPALRLKRRWERYSTQQELAPGQLPVEAVQGLTTGR